MEVIELDLFSIQLYLIKVCSIFPQEQEQVLIQELEAEQVS